MADVKVYTSSTCPYCTMAKDYLKDKGVDFDERNVQTDDQARDELISKGYTGVPVLIINGEEIVGFDQARIDAALAK